MVIQQRNEIQRSRALYILTVILSVGVLGDALARYGDAANTAQQLTLVVRAVLSLAAIILSAASGRTLAGRSPRVPVRNRGNFSPGHAGHLGVGGFGGTASGR